MDQVKSHLDVGLMMSTRQRQQAQAEEKQGTSYVYNVSSSAVFLPPAQWASLQRCSSLQALDHELDAHARHTEESGRYTLFLLGTPHGTGQRAVGPVEEWVVGARRHAWLVTTLPLADPLRVAAGAQRVVENYFAIPIETEAQQNKTHQFHLVSLPPSSEYRLSFSLLNANSTQALYGWAFQKAASAYLSPFLEEVAVLGNFTIDSQVLHYVALPKKPLYDAQAKVYYFTPSMLSYFVHPNDLNSDFTVTSEATLNFMLYVPSPDQSPLHIRYDDGSYSDTDAFLILRTGGIVIFNPERYTRSAVNVISSTELHRPISVFVQQLRTLLGVPSTFFPTTDGKNTSSSLSNGPLHILPSSSGIAKWELDVLIRQRTYENLMKAKTSILTLCQLVKKQTHMVVHDHIKDRLLIALEKLELALHQLETNSSAAYLTAHRYALEGLDEAEKAFFDREMVSLLYYPPEHEAAIYIPHFLPVFYPIVVGLFLEFKNAITRRARKWWRARAQRKPKEEEQLDNTPPKSEE